MPLHSLSQDAERQRSHRSLTGGFTALYLCGLNNPVSQEAVGGGTVRHSRERQREMTRGISSAEELGQSHRTASFTERKLPLLFYRQK